MDRQKSDDGVSWRCLKAAPQIEDFTLQVQQAMATESPLTHITTIAKHENLRCIEVRHAKLRTLGEPFQWLQGVFSFFSRLP